MIDIECPYCGKEQDINHDDGYGYKEDEKHKQCCFSCEKEFVYQTTIIFYYEAFKADCLNGKEHKYKASRTHPVEYTKMVCEDCDHKRNPTESEMAEIISNRSKSSSMK